ncbi:MAG TPA: sugar phosphate isomerase/epimerase [Terriglobia bacterium]|nr:sugar phosphate isomerase/epimerase [Terriglobia bacterium]
MHRRDMLRAITAAPAASLISEPASPASQSEVAVPADSAPAERSRIREIRDPQTKIRIGVFDTAFRDLPTEQMIDLVKDLKIEAVEVGSGNDPGQAHCDREALLADGSKLHAYLKLFENNGLMISAFSCHGNPLHPNRGRAQREDRVYRQSIELASKAGVDHIVCFSGCPGDGTGNYPNWIQSLETDEFVRILDWQWNQVLIPYWKDLAAYAKQHHVRIALEMDSGYSVYNVGSLLKLRHAVGENIGANLDLSGLFQLGINAGAVVQQLGEEGAMFHMHGKDILLNQRNIAVNGLVDLTSYEDIVHRSWSYADIGFGHDLGTWKGIVEMLQAVGYQHVISIEHESPFTSPRIGVARSAQALQQILLDRAQIL